MKWAGFQYGHDETQDVWRKSSEMRKKFGELAIKDAKDPIQMLDGLASKYTDDLQMNVFRIEYKPRQMRTIFQWAIVPSKSIAYVRPIQNVMTVRTSYEKVHVDLLDNKEIHKLYDGKIKHLCKIKYVEKGDFYKTFETESFSKYTKLIPR